MYYVRALGIIRVTLSHGIFCKSMALRDYNLEFLFIICLSHGYVLYKVILHSLIGFGHDYEMQVLKVLAVSC